MTKQNTKNKKQYNDFDSFDSNWSKSYKEEQEDRTSHFNKNDPLVKQLIKERFKKNG